MLVGIGMIWGTASSSCGKTATDRAATFERMIKSEKVPDIMFGFYEPDWTCPSSSDMTVAEGVSDWEELLAPLAKKGTVLGSPSMAKQYDEDWLEPFAESISAPWNVTAIHINKPTLAEATKVVEYYVKTYVRTTQLLLIRVYERHILFARHELTHAHPEQTSLGPRICMRP